METAHPTFVSDEGYYENLKRGLSLPKLKWFLLITVNKFFKFEVIFFEKMGLNQTMMT